MPFFLKVLTLGLINRERNTAGIARFTNRPVEGRIFKWNGSSAGRTFHICRGSPVPQLNFRNEDSDSAQERRWNEKKMKDRHSDKNDGRHPTEEQTADGTGDSFRHRHFFSLE